jgi:hypothetical protein
VISQWPTIRRRSRPEHRVEDLRTGVNVPRNRDALGLWPCGMAISGADKGPPGLVKWRQRTLTVLRKNLV